MIARIIGATFILLGCGSFGFIISKTAKTEINALENLVLAMDYMECELHCRLTPLPNLCYATAKVSKGIVSKIFLSLAEELEAQVSPNVSMCMTSALHKHRDTPCKILPFLEYLGERLGVFDLDGQIRFISSVREEAHHVLKLSREGHKIRTRSYKTMALCAGAAIVILLL